MTDFEKIIKVTRMAKRDADATLLAVGIASQWRKNLVGHITVIARPLINTGLNILTIKSLFDNEREIAIALDWYYTVYSMRMN